MNQWIMRYCLFFVALSVLNANAQTAKPKATPDASFVHVDSSPAGVPTVPVFSTEPEVVIGNIGNYGLTGNDEAQVAAQVLSWNPDFITANGDDNDSSGQTGTLDANVGRYYHAYLYPYKGSYGQGSPGNLNRFFSVLGNHDWNSSQNPKDQSYPDYFSLPGNERYYEFVWGPVHCFMLDSDPSEPDGRVSTSAQAVWLRGRLGAAKEYWKLVFLHHAPYTSGEDHGPDKDLRWPFETWGASAVFSGHARLYERLQVGGIPYFVNGAGGAALDGFVKKHAVESVMRYNAGHGAIRIKADAGSMRVDFINPQGGRLDTFSMTCPWTPTPTVIPQVSSEKLNLEAPRPLFAPNPVAEDRSTTVFFPVAAQKCEITFRDSQGRNAGTYPFVGVAKAVLEIKGRLKPGLYVAMIRVTEVGGSVKTYKRKLLVTVH